MNTTPAPTPQAAGPCPFCGGRAIPSRVLRDGYEGEQDDPDAWAHFLRCHACAAQGGWTKSESGAVRWWNMRAERDALARDLAAAQAALKTLAAYCGGCGGSGHAWVEHGNQPGGHELVVCGVCLTARILTGDVTLESCGMCAKAAAQARAALARLGGAGSPT